MITPTIGRIVHYQAEGSTYPAIVTRVWSERCVNLEVFGLPDGPEYERRPSSVLLRQPGDDNPGPGCPHCEWMPYQVKKDTGSESGEKAAGTESI